MFRRQQPSAQSLQGYAQTVEAILSAIGVDPVAARMNVDSGYGWNFQRGSALTEIYISEDEGRGYFQVLSPIMHIPQSALLPLYRHLLELNLQLTNASIGVYLDVVYVFSERPLDGLDSEEANHVIQQVAQYADDLDNRLVNEFGGRMYSQAQ